LEESAQLLAMLPEDLEGRIGALISARRLFVDSFINEEGQRDIFVWPWYLQKQELNIVEQLKRLLLHKEDWHGPIDLDEALNRVTKALGITLAEQQEKAVENSILEKVHIITGGPGTGKSTITKVILNILSAFSERILLAAPTGRAAKRLSEITGRDASTIHSLLSLDFFGETMRSRLSEKLACDVLIIDEASMIDTGLMSVLCECLPDTAKLILIGDVDQLPSVGPGNVLRDLIDSGQVPLTRLTEIFRQAVNSRIVMNAHKINNGIFPDISIDKSGDFFFIAEKQPEKIAQLIVSLVSERLKKTYDLHPLRDMQVLCPMHKGPIGTQELNIALQAALNDLDDKKEKTMRGNTIFAVGDKVMQIRNNYDKNVYNGDIGIIKKVKVVDKQLIVQMDGEREIEYEFSELNELELAYAVTVHKYQGSECPCIILPIHESQHSMLYRHLLYTAVTRGKQLLLLVGSREALSTAVRNDNARERYSALGRMFNAEQQCAFPEIKIVPMLGSAGYEDWVEENVGW
jgi:exodeoxyribonuclease V alpha subunit